MNDIGRVSPAVAACVTPGSPQSVFPSESAREACYAAMALQAGCGPYDGGCVVLAQALQIVYGGDIFVIEGRWIRGGGDLRYAPLMAHHAVLRLTGRAGRPARYADAGGAVPGEQMLAEFADLDGVDGEFVDLALRPMQPDDLESAVRRAGLAAALAQLLCGEDAETVLTGLGQGPYGAVQREEFLRSTPAELTPAGL